MNKNETYQEIFGYWTEANNKMDALCIQYMECIQAFSETDNVNMLLRVSNDLKALTQKTELGLSRSMDRLDNQINKHEPLPQILTQEEIEALLNTD